MNAGLAPRTHAAEKVETAAHPAPWAQKRRSALTPGSDPSGLALSCHNHAHLTPSSLSSHRVGGEGALGWQSNSWLNS